MDEILLTGLWQQGQGDRYVWYNADWPTFLARANTLAASGYLMTSLDVAEAQGRVSWSGAWEVGRGQQELASGLTWDEIRTRDGQLRAQGLSLAGLRSHAGRTARAWAGFWRAGSGPSVLVGPVSWAEFWSAWLAQHAAGNRLIDFDTYVSGGTRLWAGVWQPAAGDQYLWVGLPWSDFAARNSELRGRGYGLLTVRSYADNVTRLWAGVWRNPPASSVFVADLTVPQFWDDWERQTSRRLRLTCLHAWSGTGYAPTQTGRVRLGLHIKVVSDPLISIDSMLENMRSVYEPVGIVVDVKSREVLSSSDILDIDVGTCSLAGISAQQQQLFSNRNYAAPEDIVAYFVRSTLPPYNGCASFPSSRPGAVISSYSSPWTLAHEVGHVLGLYHVADPSRLMTGLGTSNIVDPPPELSPEEVRTMLSSAYVRPYS